MTVFLDPERRVLILVHQPGVGGFGPPTNGEVLVDADGQTTGRAPNVELKVKCRSCPQRRIFSAPDDRLLARQVASSGWNIDGGVAECPGCWLAFQSSVLRAARGNS